MNAKLDILHAWNQGKLSRPWFLVFNMSIVSCLLRYSLDSSLHCIINLIYTYFSLDNKIYIEFATLHCITQSFLPQDKIFVEILYGWHRVCSLYRISISYSEFCIVDKSLQIWARIYLKTKNVTKIPYMTKYVCI